HLNQGLTESVDYADTFIDAAHVAQAFAQQGFAVRFRLSACTEQEAAAGGGGSVGGEERVITEGADVSDLPGPPYRVIVPTVAPEGAKRSKGAKGATSSTVSSAADETVLVVPYRRANPGPYPEDRSPVNSIRFTSTQVAAIRSGCNPGLTMVVGPPGTGKTDVAVQIIVNLYRNHPTQKILVVTHSNAALNDLFEKIMEREVAPRHLLRLGAGEIELRDSLSAGGALGGGKGQGEAFSKQGRVNWSLSRRLQLLAQVQRLGASLGVAGDAGATCETAAYFRLQHVQARVEKFRLDAAAAMAKMQMGVGAGIGGSGKKAKGRGKADVAEAPVPVSPTVSQLFPFAAFFADSPAPLFSDMVGVSVPESVMGSSASEAWGADMSAAEGCFRHLQGVFAELADYRAFELLRSQSLRADFLLTKQVRGLLFCYVDYVFIVCCLLCVDYYEFIMYLCCFLCICVYYVGRQGRGDWFEELDAGAVAGHGR
ncbi:hypothetical protein B484DRAFT_201589, partial [Ochromonadaceae sp. CCMP2298]